MTISVASYFSSPNLVWIYYNYHVVEMLKWIVDPPIQNTADPVGAVIRTIGWSSSGFTVCLKKWDMSLCMRCTTWLLPVPPEPLRKILYPFLFFHVLLHLCNSCTMLYCTLLYGIDMCSSCVNVCNSCKNSYPAFLLLLHTTYIVYLLYFWCCHDSLYLWYLRFLVPDFVMCRNLGHVLFYHLVQYLEQPSPMQTVVYCFPNLAGLCQMLHSLLWIFVHSHVWYAACLCMSHSNFGMLILCHLPHFMGNRGEALNDSIFLVLYGFCTFLYVVLPAVSFSWWHLILFVISSLWKHEDFLCSEYLLLYWNSEFLLSLLMIGLHHT